MKGEMTTNAEKQWKGTWIGIFGAITTAGIIALITLVLNLKTDVEVIKIKLEQNGKLEKRVESVETDVNDIKIWKNGIETRHNNEDNWPNTGHKK